MKMFYVRGDIYFVRSYSVFSSSSFCKSPGFLYFVIKVADVFQSTTPAFQEGDHFLVPLLKDDSSL